MICFGQPSVARQRTFPWWTSATRPAYIEDDLSQIFTNEDVAYSAVLWLLIHRTRFGVKDAPATDCALERWLDAGSKEGEVARDRLALQVQIALKVLGSGFLEATLAHRCRQRAVTSSTPNAAAENAANPGPDLYTFFKRFHRIILQPLRE